MAIKAGLVGVNPKGVDHNGMRIASGGSGVDEAQLTANGKKFFFAYDETSEKYGYKLDGAGDFIPFELAGSGLGWVKPADLVTTGLTPASGITIEEGGYYDDTDNHIVYVDMVFSTTASSSTPISGFPHPPKVTYGSYLMRCQSTTVEIAKDNYNANYYEKIDYSGNMAESVTANAVYHVYGQYEYTV